MNPYQPPQCSEPAAEVAGAAMMQVRYSWAYSILFIVTGLIGVSLAVVMYSHSPPLAGMSVFWGVLHLSLAVLFRRRACFEVFEDRIEILSPAFPRWRRAKPLGFTGARGPYRWIAKREDFSRFIEWRDESRG
jgi:hypothetical protein